MRSLKTIAATAVIAVAGTAAAFSGLHLGQPSADAANAGNQPIRAKTTYSVTLTAAQLAQLTNGRGKAATVPAAHHGRRAHRQNHHAGYQNGSRSSYGSGYRSHSGDGSRGYSSGSSRSYYGGSGYGSNRCYNYGGGNYGGGSGRGCNGGCW